MKQHNSIFPDILETAQQYGVGEYREVGGRPEEVRVNCPFCCEVLNKPDKGQHLYLNTAKQIFKCFRCNSTGGVAHFIAKLNGASVQEIIEHFKAKARKDSPNRYNKPQHPALGLNAYQLKKIGFDNSKVFSEAGMKWRKKNPEYVKRELDWIWEKWKGHVEWQKRWALTTLVNYIPEGKYSKAIEDIKAQSKELGEDILPSVLRAYSHLNTGKTLSDWATPPFMVLSSNGKEKDIENQKTQKEMIV